MCVCVCACLCVYDHLQAIYLRSMFLSSSLLTDCEVSSIFHFYSNKEHPYIYSHYISLFYPLPLPLTITISLTLPLTSYPYLYPYSSAYPFSHLIPLPLLFLFPCLSPPTLTLPPCPYPSSYPYPPSHPYPFFLPLPLQQHPTTCPVTLEDLDALLSSAKATMFQDPDVLLNALNLRSKVLELEGVCVRTLPMITTASQEHMTEVIIIR